MSSNSNIYKFNSLQIFLQKQKKKQKNSLQIFNLRAYRNVATLSLLVPSLGTYDITNIKNVVGIKKVNNHLYKSIFNNNWRKYNNKIQIHNHI